MVVLWGKGGAEVKHDLGYLPPSEGGILEDGWCSHMYLLIGPVCLSLLTNEHLSCDEGLRRCVRSVFHSNQKRIRYQNADSIIEVSSSLDSKVTDKTELVEQWNMASRSTMMGKYMGETNLHVCESTLFRNVSSLSPGGPPMPDLSQVFGPGSSPRRLRVLRRAPARRCSLETKIVQFHVEHPHELHGCLISK